MGRQNTVLAWALAVAVAVIAALSIALVGTTNRLAELESGAEQGQVANAPAPEPRRLQGELTQATPANPEAVDCYNDMGADGAVCDDLDPAVRKDPLLPLPLCCSAFVLV